MSLEQRVRTTLKDAGSRIDTTEKPPSRPTTAISRSRRRRFRPALTFVASFAAVVLFGAVAVFVSGDAAGPANDAEPAFSGLLGSIVELLPDGFDPEQAPSLLTLEGSPDETATLYLETRIPVVEPGVKRVEEQDGYTLVQWAWGNHLDSDYAGGDRGLTGWLLLRPIPRGFEVVAATTDGVDLSGLTLSDGVVDGVVESDSGELIGADVLNLDGSIVEGAPHPNGFNPDAMTLWGTAGAGNPPLELDVPVSGPVVIRVNQVGGTFLSISEVVIGSAAEDMALGEQQVPGRPISDQLFDEVFGNEESADFVRESATFIHARDQDDIGLFSLYAAAATSDDGVEFDQPVMCIYQYGRDGGVRGSKCGPDVSLDQPGVAVSSSCGNPDVTMFSAWALNPEVEVVEFTFSDGFSELLDPNMGFLIWAWRNTKQLTGIRVDNASPEVERAVGEFIGTLPHAPCD